MQKLITSKIAEKKTVAQKYIERSKVNQMVVTMKDLLGSIENNKDNTNEDTKKDQFIDFEFYGPTQGI